MYFEIQIDCDNAAFEGAQLGPELARILRREADTLEEAGRPDAGTNAVLVNGDVVGEASLVETTDLTRPAGSA